MTQSKDKPKILFYSQKEKDAGKRLQRVIETFVPKSSLLICRTFDELILSLRQHGCKIVILILLTTTRKELLDLLAIRDYLSDIRKIVVLKDQEKDTISKVHRLYPRYITYADSDFIDVGAVLSKMMSLTHKAIGEKSI